MVPSILRGKTIVAAAVLAALAPFAHGAELVTLTNGYAMRCDHHAQVEGHVRLYLGAGEENYIEFASRDIAGVERVPDLPAPQARRGEQAVAQPPAVNAAGLTAADLHEMLSAAGKAYHLDVDLLASVVKAESDGDAHAVSRAGAAGLMQLMPQTAAEMGVHDRFEPGQNVRGGSAYLDALLTRYRDNLALALAAYNAGPEAVDRYRGIPPYYETRVYVARVIHEFNRRVLARQAQAKRLLPSPAAQPAGTSR